MRSMRFLTGALGCSALLSVAAVLWFAGGSAPPIGSRTGLRDVQLPGEIELATGMLLIAAREMRDPNFAESVILITNYDEQGAMGLIINRRTDTPASRVLEWKEAKGRSERVYMGGPVEAGGVLALIRSKAKLDQSRRVAAEVYLGLEKNLLQKYLIGGSGPEKFRIFLGYAGWGPEQLENEVDLGAWHLMRGSADLVFDADPDSLWSRLIKGTETQIATLADVSKYCILTCADR